MKQMTQTEHLKLIRARCVELLEIAEKRTAGRWQQGDDAGEINMDMVYRQPKMPGRCAGMPTNGTLSGISREQAESDATFIASCAGAAEAGWRATVAAVDTIFNLSTVTYGWDGDCGALAYADTLADSVTSAWPIELLNNK
jgi:hypothetical protein